MIIQSAMKTMYIRSVIANDKNRKFDPDSVKEFLEIQHKFNRLSLNDYEQSLKYNQQAKKLTVFDVYPKLKQGVRASIEEEEGPVMPGLQRNMSGMLIVIPQTSQTF